MPILPILLVAAALLQPAETPVSILRRYVTAIGGETALGAATSRVTEGDFDNGRGLRARFRIVEEAPNRKLTLIGTDPIDSPTGSGRGFDGKDGWDKSFIGTGLRPLQGRELSDAARDADFLRPIHLADDCASTSVEATSTDNVLVCMMSDGGSVRHAFDKNTGLLAAQDIVNGSRKIRVIYEDYRTVGGMKLPFVTRIDVGGAVIRYQADAIRLNEPIDRAIFRQPVQ